MDVENRIAIATANRKVEELLNFINTSETETERLIEILANHIQVSRKTIRDMSIETIKLYDEIDTEIDTEIDDNNLTAITENLYDLEDEIDCCDNIDNILGNIDDIRNFDVFKDLKDNLETSKSAVEIVPTKN